MRTVVKSIQIGLSALFGVLGWLFGGFDELIGALICFVILDYASGVACAVVNGHLSSAVGFRGIARKVTIFALVAVAAACDRLLPGTGTPLRTATILFYLSNEGISLLENAAGLGLPVPEAVKRILSQFTEKEDNE